jgi:hypothetical protein
MLFVLFPITELRAGDAEEGEYRRAEEDSDVATRGPEVLHFDDDDSDVHFSLFITFFLFV